MTRRTRESLLLCEAAGFDVILVETVGVGQSETAVADMTDMFLLLLLPAGGDELQGIKRGIMELADLVLVNKCDGERAESAEQTITDFSSALGFIRPRFAGWQPRVMACSALNYLGMEEVWEQVETFRSILSKAGELDRQRAYQARAWLWSETAEALIADLRDHPQVRSLVPELEAAVTEGRLPAAVAAQRLIEHYKSRS